MELYLPTKKKKKKEAESALSKDAVEYDDYGKLLHRVYELLISSGSGDLAIKKWRVHMQEPQISPDGPDKVVVHNFATLCRLMNRETHHV
eukprot:CAMPEP_0198227876 /NCGR_PEP_ID=MMETSP1445-20131203/110992_1 /TAXON_ID=36898 /ORGANISM="Pyramimonas sp., Strain CCMP2087" /LENGTH=89 /DNA_ID=CAMNT_0043908069 /DNA_START=186 /DNA_END=451 /DNA_ORIENTATION=-